MKTDAKWLLLALSPLSLGALGCLVPPPQAPSAAPGSAASIGGGAAAAPAAAPEAAPAPVAAAPAAPGAPVPLPAGFKECGPAAMIDDGEDGNNQNLPNDNRGGYWYTFRDKKGTTIEPTAGEDGGTFAMTEGSGHGSQFGARYHGKIGTGAPLLSPSGPSAAKTRPPRSA
jgi:hypothetical protein